MTINQRVKILLEDLKLSQKDIADKMQVKKQFVSDMFHEKASIGLSVVIKLLDLNKDINARWLINEEGDKLLKSDFVSNGVKEPIKEYTKKCLVCEEKDKRIKELKSHIETQNITIDCLNNKLKKDL